MPQNHLQFEEIELDETLTIPQNFGVGYCPWEVKMPQINTELTRFDKEQVAPRVIRSAFLEINENYDGYYKIYTDGSKNDTGVGFGVCSEDLDLVYRAGLPSEWSVFSAELIAIEYALERINESDHDKFVVYTDSLSAIQATNNEWTVEPLPQMILEQLELVRNKDVVLC